jgi:hypothetical protein
VLCVSALNCRELFRLPEDVDISLTFGCKEPMSGSHLKLEGMGAFDAAVHCASVAAAERQQKVKKSYSTGGWGVKGELCGCCGCCVVPGPRADVSLSAILCTGATLRDCPSATCLLHTGNLDASLAASAAQQQVTRSASSNNMPAHQISASAGAAAGGAGLSPPAPPPSAAGASAARSAAQDRRQRFAGQQQQQPAGQGQQHHQQQSQQPAGMRSRSFSAFSSSAVPRAGAREPPAAFRSILGLLNSGSSGSSGSGGGSQQPAAAGQQGRASASTIPQASPRGGAGSPLPPLSPGSATASASAAPRDARLLSAAKRERLSLRQINSLTDVPEADETLAVGSLSGRFRFTLKAFSRKVARSLSFSNKSFADDELAGARAGGGGSSSSMARAGSAGGLAGPFMDDLPAGSVSSSRGPSVTAYSSHPSAEAPLAAHPSPRGMMAASPLPPPTPAGIHSC